MTLAGSAGRTRSRPSGTAAACRGAGGATVGRALHVDGDGGPDDWLAVVAAAAWCHLDTVGRPVDIDGLEPPAG